jgi:hypothetical protein
LRVNQGTMPLQSRAVPARSIEATRPSSAFRDPRGAHECFVTTKISGATQPQNQELTKH